MAKALNWYSWYRQEMEVPQRLLQYLMILAEDDCILNYLDSNKARSRDEFMACTLYLSRWVFN